MNIAIIGAGMVWISLIADELFKRNYKVRIFERENEIFNNASGNNQKQTSSRVSLSTIQKQFYNLKRGL